MFSTLVRNTRRKKRGRVLAMKLGFNPNSSSLGVDVTFLIFGATAVSLLTPVLAAMVRLRRVEPATTGTGTDSDGAVAQDS